MKKYGYIFLLLATVLFAACTAEERFPDEDFDKDALAIVSLSSKNLLAVDMNGTKAGGLNTILSRFIDVNIRINLKDGSSQNYYCKAAEPTKFYQNSAAITDKSIYFLDNKNLSNIFDRDAQGNPTGISIHTDILASKVSNIEAIANYGSEIPAGTDWTTLTEKETDNHLYDKDGQYCLMYGNADKSTDNTHIDKKPCKLYQIKLKRSRAMVTVQIINPNDGKSKGLYKGVTITPNKITLKNVPTDCNLSALATSSNKIETIDKSIELAKSLSLTGSISGDQPGSYVGEHITESVTPANCKPFFLFENMQGYGPTNIDPTKKYPESGWNPTIAKDRQKNFKYSYIEIEADYKYREHGTVKIGGTIIYRFFLGANDLDCFNIEGNGYYKLTLRLNGYGGAKEDGKTDANGNLIVNQDDVSWRVDMETKDWGFEKDQYDFDCHFFNSFTKVVGTNWKFGDVYMNGTVSDGATSWLVLKVKPGYGVEWANPTQVTANGYELDIDKNGVLRFQVQPMYYDGTEDVDPRGTFLFETYKNPIKKSYREMIIEVVQTNVTNPKKEKITVRQWVPIGLETASGERFFLERFEESPVDQIGWPWLYENDPLNTLYDPNGSKGSYVLNPTTRFQVAQNAILLSWKPNNASGKQNVEGKLGAGDICKRKGNDDFQGAPADFYALPNIEMMKAAFAYQHNNAWGPFEPMHIYEDYWTCNVPDTDRKKTIFYNANTKRYEETNMRNAVKRVRSIYDAHYANKIK